AIGANRILFQHVIAKKLNCDASAGFLTSFTIIGIAKKFNTPVLKTVDFTKYIDKETGGNPFSKATPPHNLFTMVYTKLTKPAL
uniref:Uncharacterized protein n=2 Tax=Ciona intestinalis TaxID=7719 RepID=F7AK48_CIOIN